EEIEIIRKFAESIHTRFAVADVWGKGGEGAIILAKQLIEAVEEDGSAFTPLYDWDQSMTEKIETIATKIYGANHVEYSPKAKQDLKRISDLGMDNLAVCMAKTQYSFSDNPKALGRPKNFTLTIREIEIASGAGFVIPITGDIMRMPGLPAHPAAEHIDIDDNGCISGLF